MACEKCEGSGWAVEPCQECQGWQCGGAGFGDPCGCPRGEEIRRATERLIRLQGAR